VKADNNCRAGDVTMPVQGVSADDQGIFRAMVEENGMPKLGTTATTLGVRKGKDIETDANGMVHTPAFQSRGKNGVSCAPTINDLPSFALAVEWGGTHKMTAVWRIAEEDLGPDLVAQQDGPAHISIAPARSMAYDEYVKTIQATASKWVKVSKGTGG
jgi:hypothetical protein